jgi:RimJ/RimL family protein N-acetyltransferase
MAAVPSPLSSYTLRLAEPGDFDAYMDAFEAVAAEGRWMGTEAPIDRDARRTGFDRAVAGAARMLCDFGFETLGLRRAELNAEVTNTASRRVAEKAGFELEGVRRAWRTVRGVPTDFALYSRLADPL